MTSYRQLFTWVLLVPYLTTSIGTTRGLPKSLPTMGRSKKIQIKTILASIGANCKLRCPIRLSENVQWYINGKLLNHTQETAKFSIKRRHRKEILKISKVMIQDGGTYSCSVNDITTSWRVIVKKDKKSGCRPKRHTPASDECPKRSGTKPLTYCTQALNFEKCSSFAGVPQDFKVIEFLHKRKPVIQAGWKMPRTGNNDLWGYDLELVGHRGDLGERQCVEIYQKDLTYWNFMNLKFGAEYNVKLRSLPSNTFHKLKIKIKEKCQYEKFKLESAACCLLSDENSTLVADEGKILLSWKVQCPENGISLNRFTIYWSNLQLFNSQKCTDEATFNQHPISEAFNYTIHLNEECQRYNYSIKVYGRDSNNTRTDKGVRIVVAFPENTVPIQPPPSPKKSGSDDSDLKIIVAVFGVLLGSALVALFFVYRRFCGTVKLELPQNANDSHGDNNDGALIMKEKRVFIIHARCCDKCDWVIHCLAKLLNSTNAIEANVDLWHLQDIASDPMRWYGMEVANADGVVILASHHMKKLYDCRDTPKTTKDLLPVKAQLNFVAGEIRQEPGSRKFISAYFSYNGQQTDFPSFLNSRLAHKLLKDLDRFIFHLLRIEAIQPYRTQPIAILGGTPAFNSKKEDLLRAISEANEYHVTKDQNNAMTTLST
ncbi:uncharacterized protein LOC110252588 [Exaiptasia diaphana]|uniref:SEFIR domain-containing protein n=1 Tax=Exaiptasia diaphana TaxID=2652724 RepID=A0A913Y5L2_EXADI|nr:uncharacterized protein LOC110252588 [Exaiptasia diaphana]KXJ22435.1 hypothetical protein AC249_AIPGENE27386 [Exaiptasia diaphana]